MTRWFAAVVCLTGTLLCAIPAGAQGVQTAVLTGATTSADGVALPGVTITASSPALQGERVEVTDVNGVYSIKGLPSGTYTVTFDLSNFKPARRDNVALTVGGTIEVSANMSLAGRTETVTVTAEAPSSLTTVATGKSLDKKQVDQMPIGRRPVDIAELSPGLTTNTFTTGQLAISGAYGFDNVFMVDGVDVNDTLNGTANNLFVEDAIENTTVLTNGISAEYGRFSGGLVNLVHKSGGNLFSGSFRENLANPAWINETPLERKNGVEHQSVLGKTHEATFGGPISKDRIWFFGAGRWETTNTPNTFSQSGVAYTRTDTNRRGELKVTGRFPRLLSSARAGTHDLKGGAEYFVTTGIGGNSQSPTGYVFVTDFLTDAAGKPVLESNLSPTPRFVPGQSQVWNFQATRGAKIDIKTTSFYAQDRWSVNRRLTLDLGTRFEVVRSNATGDIQAVDTATIVPRLGAVFALDESGKTTVQGSYAHYSGKYGQVQFSANSNVSRPSEVDYVYTGPAGQGSNFAPGLDPANYTAVVFASFPTANVKVAKGLQSPIVREGTVALGRQLGQQGHAKATYVWRKTTNFVEDFASLQNGVVDVPLVGTLTNRVLDNTDVPRRSYQAAIFQTDYRVADRMWMGADYTLQVKDHGNFAGEAAGVPGAQSIYGDFPEIYAPALDRLMPYGRPYSFHRHKMRAYGTYTQSMGRFGSVDLSPIWRVNSGRVFSLTAATPVPAAQLARNPGYPTNDVNPAVRAAVFFGDRGPYFFNGYGGSGFAASYAIPVWKSAAPCFKGG